MAVQKAVFVFNRVETAAALNGAPTLLYSEQWTEVDKPFARSKLDWLLQSFRPSIPVGVSVFTVTVFEGRRGEDRA